MSKQGTTQVLNADIYQLLFLLRRAEGPFKLNDSEFPLEREEEAFLRDFKMGDKFKDILQDKQNIEKLKEALRNKDNLKNNPDAMAWFKMLNPDQQEVIVKLRKIRDDQKFLNDLRSRQTNYASANKTYEATKKEYTSKLNDKVKDIDLQMLKVKEQEIIQKVSQIQELDKENHPEIIALRQEYNGIKANLNLDAKELDDLMRLRSLVQSQLDSVKAQELIQSEIDFLEHPDIKGKSAFEIKDRTKIDAVRKAQIVRIQGKLYEEIRTTHENLSNMTGKFQPNGPLMNSLKEMLKPGNPATASLTDTEKDNVRQVLEKLGNLEGNMRSFVEVFKAFEKQTDPDSQVAPFNNVLHSFDVLKDSMIDYVNFYAKNNINEIIIPVQFDNQIKLAMSGTTFTALGFQSYVIQPFQTGLKYQLFAREMSKLSKDGDPLHPLYSSFGEKSKAMGDTLERYKSQVEEKAKAGAIKVAIKEADILLGAVQPDVDKATKKSDVRIAINFKGNKKAGVDVNKALKDRDIGLPETWTVIKRGKKKEGRIEKEDILNVGQRLRQFVGNRREYFIKENGKTIFKVTVTGDKVNIRPSKGNILSGEELIRMHQVVQNLNKTKSLPTIFSDNTSKMAVLMSHGIYQLGKNEKNRISKDRTMGKDLPIVTVKSKSSQVNEKFQQAIKNGLIPRLMNENFLNTDFVNQGKMKGEIEINQSQFPHVAIEQYQAALAAGFTPNFSSSTKAAVDSYVNKRLKDNLNDRQITVTALPVAETGLVDGEEVCKRVLQATADGLTVKLTPEAEQALKEYVNNLSSDNEQRVELTGQPDPYIIMRNLALTGILVKLPQDLIKAKEMCRQVNEKTNAGAPIYIDSASNERNLLALKDYLEKGFVVNVVNPNSLLDLAKDDVKLSEINLGGISPSHLQIEQVKKLAAMGLCGVNVKGPIPENTKITITSSNALHAIKTYEKLLQQGFKPEFSTTTKVLVEKYMSGTVDEKDSVLRENNKYNVFSGSLSVKVPVLKPKELLENIQSLCQMGLVPVLEDDSIDELRKYVKERQSKKEEIRILISGRNPNAVFANVALAHKMGAQVGFFEKNTDPHMKPIAILNIVNKNNEIEIEKTLLRANDIARAGYNLTLPPEIIKRYREINDDSRKRNLDASALKTEKKFLRTVPTKEAKEAKKTLEEDKKLLSWISINLSQETQDQLRKATAQEYSLEKSIQSPQHRAASITPMAVHSHAPSSPASVVPAVGAVDNFESIKKSVIEAFQSKIHSEASKAASFRNSDPSKYSSHMAVHKDLIDMRNQLNNMSTVEQIKDYLSSISGNKKYKDEIQNVVKIQIEKLSPPQYKGNIRTPGQ